MTPEEQRRLGVRLATEYNAPKTLAAIKDPNICFEDILKTAAEEVGNEKLVSVLLENEPSWAQSALMFVPGLGDGREDLLKKTSELADADLQLNAENFTADQPTQISAFRLALQLGWGYICWFTMYWQNPDSPGVTQPSAGTPDSGQWKWSPKMSFGSNNPSLMKCSDFALPNSPLQPGATVWMVIAVSGASNWIETNYRFIYDPNSNATATLNAS